MIIAANWKMYTRAADAQVLATAVRNGAARIEGIGVVICPPAIWLSELRLALGRGGKVELGGQNMFYEEEGPYTGEISPLMLRDLASHVIIGHSERREHFGERDYDVNEKVIAALEAGLTPIICVGEKKKKALPKEPREQLRAALLHLAKRDFEKIIVAYEPVWAIGTGDNAEPEYVGRVINYLRELGLTKTTFLYGGSTSSKNVRVYARRPEIDGLLVGAASLRASEFIKICQIWSEVKLMRR